VSRRHAALIVDETSARVANLGSRNGLTVDGVEVVEPACLNHGAKIAIGSECLVFLVVNEVAVGAET
jgi:pSer/pThr/pTyr-binding forkhead associated (FHA) protein